jgi:hypothetical protein
VGRHGKHSNTEVESICRNAKVVAGRLWGRQEGQTGAIEAVVGRLMGRQIGRLAEVYSGREPDAF